MDTDMTAPGFGHRAEACSLDRIAYGLQFGAGPVWNARQGSWLWVDLLS